MISLYILVWIAVSVSLFIDTAIGGEFSTITHLSFWLAFFMTWGVIFRLIKAKRDDRRKEEIQRDIERERLNRAVLEGAAKGSARG